MPSEDGELTETCKGSKYRCGISQLTAAHFVGGHILGN
jgi:hypothetical protein